MNFIAGPQLINLLGCVVGGALFLLLGAAVLRERAGTRKINLSERRGADFFWLRRRLIAFGALGCVWNFGQFNLALATDFSGGKSFLWGTAAVYAALGFLPAVLVEIDSRDDSKCKLRIQNKHRAASAYLLSAAAAAMHFFAAAGGGLPSYAALQILAAGYSVIAGLFFFDAHSGESMRRRFSRVLALALFAFSLFHLGFPHTEGGFYPFELVGHQASLPLVAAVLYRNFRFSFADLLLKRAFSLIFLAAPVFAVNGIIVEPLSALHRNHPANDPLKTGVMLVAWILTALLYEPVCRFTARIVDRRLLSRPNYSKIKNEFMHKVFASDQVGEILEAAGRACARVSNARNYSISEKDWNAERDFPLAEPAVTFEHDAATVLIPTVEKPHFEISLTGLRGARQILSEEFEFARIDRAARRAADRRFARLARAVRARAARAGIRRARYGSRTARPALADQSAFSL